MRFNQGLTILGFLNYLNFTARCGLAVLFALEKVTSAFYLQFMPFGCFFVYCVRSVYTSCIGSLGLCRLVGCGI